MERKIINRIAGAFAIVPILTLSVPIPHKANPSLEVTQPPAPFIEKANNVVGQFLAFNQSEEMNTNKEEEIRKARAEAIDAYYESKNMPLLGYGMKMVEEAEKNGIDWRLLPAISVIETTGGKNLCKRLPAHKRFNPFGWGSCKIGFESFDIAIEIVAKNLGGNNPKTARHYDDKTTEEIIDAYNPPSIVPSYKSKVLKVMNTIGTPDFGEELTVKKEQS